MSGRRRWAVLAAVAAGVIASATLAFLFLRGSRPTAHRAAASNVILITLDTFRSDRLSCYGSRIVDTPNIDAFAAEGVRFTNAASTVPLTLPAHASIMTGLYPPGHGVRENVGTVLDGRIPTLAELLGKSGWTTGGFVSAFVLDHRWGIGRGFDRYFDDFDLGGLGTANVANVGLVRRDGADTVAAALNWLDKRPAGRPFFLWLHLFDPHDPYVPKEPFKSRYPGRPYDAVVAYTDSLVGDFRRALDERHLLKDSLVILTSDHGEGLGDHGETFHGFLVYDTTIHAALIVRPPGGVRGGRVVDRTVSHVDLLPTILDLVGLKAPENVHGRSLAPLVAGRDVPWDRPVYSESLYPLLHYGWAPLRALRAGRFKLIDVPRPELYDVAQDPTEEQNLHSVDPNRARELTADLGRLRHRIESGKLPAGNAPEIDQRAVARLRSLGYLAGGGGVAVGKESERVRADPKDRLQLHQKIVDAQSRISHREYDAAGRLLEQVLAEDAEIVDAHQMLGQIAAERRRPRDAIRHFKRALELNPMHEQSLFDLAAEYADLGRWDEALAGFRRVLELKGADARASLAIADVYVRLKRFDEAADVLDKASQSGESAPFFANKMGEVRVEQGRDDEAVPQFERAVALDDGFALPHFNLGFLREKRGEGRLAAEQYARALELEPAFFRAQFNLGRLHAAMGDVERARQSWEAFLRSNPGSVQGRYYFAKLLMDTGGDLVRAENLAREGIALDPGHAEGPLGYYVLADLLNRRGRAAEARAAAATGRRIEEAVKR
ncbi:MAG TPA: sulfatase-like hydrolase/transferase [Thermoanaerobaculia bacterium]|nr:sulfatase-like hydrolase/transferase [Thermoanaerobaculia bacterium]